MSWTWPGSQQVSSGWNGTFTQSGTSVKVTNASYDGSIAPGSSVTVGFTATGSAPATLSVTC
jgi:endo-1,4-beta-xylanase